MYLVIQPASVTTLNYWGNLFTMFSDLVSRGLVHQSTSGITGPMTAYIGFDPTATSLHVGSLLPILNMVRLRRDGHRVIALVGGGTGLIGDPSGKQSERGLLTREQIETNVVSLRDQIGRFVDTDCVVNNADWLGGLSLMDFLRDIGKHFSVSAMVARDSVAMRLGREYGISFTEFSYMLLQAYDFLALYDRFGCTLQCGGSDQWGNIVSGIDLVRRLRGVEVHGLTFPLVTRSDGSKFGKSEGDNIWLDPGLTSPYAFYQFWFNTPDTDVERRLKEFTFLPLDDIQRVMCEPVDIRLPQKLLAEQVTTFVHGRDALDKVLGITEVLFHGGWSSLSATDLEHVLVNAPYSELAPDKLGVDLVSILVAGGLYPSRSQARTGVRQGGVSVNGKVEIDPQRTLTHTDFLLDKYIILCKGKRNHHIIRLMP